MGYGSAQGLQEYTGRYDRHVVVVIVVMVISAVVMEMCTIVMVIVVSVHHCYGKHCHSNRQWFMLHYCHGNVLVMV